MRFKSPPGDEEWENGADVVVYCALLVSCAQLEALPDRLWTGVATLDELSVEDISYDEEPGRDVNPLREWRVAVGEVALFNRYNRKFSRKRKEKKNNP